MKWFYWDWEQLTINNNNYREVVYTGKHLQFVLMCLQPNEEIGMEVHPENDQFFRFEAGEGKVYIDDNVYDVKDGSVCIVPAWARHNVVNTSSTEQLKFYTLYWPSHHKDWVIQITKKDEQDYDPDFDGMTTE